MNNDKKKEIKSCRELLEKYLHPEGQNIYIPLYCPLCNVFFKGVYCSKCPLKGKGGCLPAKDPYFKSMRIPNPTKGQYKWLKSDADFLEKVIPVLEGIPEDEFAQMSDDYYKELDRYWDAKILFPLN